MIHVQTENIDLSNEAILKDKMYHLAARLGSDTESIEGFAYTVPDKGCRYEVFTIEANRRLIACGMSSEFGADHIIEMCKEAMEHKRRVVKDSEW